MLTIPGEVKGTKQAFNAISTDTAVTQDLGVIGRDNLNRIRWGNLLTLPVADGGLLYVAPVYASPGTSDAASTYPRLIRVAMLYGDKVGYGPTVSDALTELFGPRAGATATNVAPTDGKPQAAAGTPEAPPAAQPPANADGQAPQVAAPPAAAIPPGESVRLSPGQGRALQEVEVGAVGGAGCAAQR